MAREGRSNMGREVGPGSGKELMGRVWKWVRRLPEVEASEKEDLKGRHLMALRRQLATRTAQAKQSRRQGLVRCKGIRWQGWRTGAKEPMGMYLDGMPSREPQPRQHHLPHVQMGFASPTWKPSSGDYDNMVNIQSSPPSPHLQQQELHA